MYVYDADDGQPTYKPTSGMLPGSMHINGALIAAADDEEGKVLILFALP